MNKCTKVSYNITSDQLYKEINSSQEIDHAQLIIKVLTINKFSVSNFPPREEKKLL